MIALDDHALQLQWDSSKIDKGFKDLERKFTKFGKMDIKASVSPDMKRGGARGSASSISQGERDRGIANLDATTLKARQQIEALNKVGSKEARSKILALEAAVKRLKLAEDGLNKSTNTTDKTFIRYKKTLRDTKNQINSMSKSTNTLARKFTTTKFAADGLASSLKNLGRSWLSVFAVMAGARHIVNVGRSFEDMSSTLLLSSGNAKQAAVDFEFLAAMSQKMGLDIDSTSKAYAKFAVAGSTVGLSNEVVKNTFEDISIAVRATGLETQRANLAFLAFQQMLSGPVIQSQEMNQLVEQMPQFTGLAKKALQEMGHEVINIRDTIATGTVESSEFVKKVAHLMKTQAVDTGAYAKSLESVTAQMARLKTATDLNILTFSKSGFTKGYAKFLQSLTQSMRKLKPLFVSLGASLGEAMEFLAIALDISNILLMPVLLLVDAFNDISSSSKEFFSNIADGNTELKKGETILNAWKRWWMGITGLALQLKGHFKIGIGMAEELVNMVNSIQDPFAFFKALSPNTEIGAELRAKQSRSEAEGTRLAGIKTGDTTIENEITINGDPDLIRSTLDDVMGSYMQNAYSGGG